MAAPTYRSSSTVASSATTKVLTKPTGTASGDSMIAVLMRESSADPTGVPSGWTLLTSKVQGSFKAWVYEKVAGGSEGANYTWTWAASVYGKGWMASYSGGPGSGSIAAGSSANSGSGTTYTLTGITPSESDTMLVAGMFNVNDATLVKPSASWTDRVDGTGLGYLGTEKTHTSGATGDFTGAVGANDTWWAFLVALRGTGGATPVSRPPFRRPNRLWVRRY